MKRTPALSIGLFGGSFNPAHGGHLHLAKTAKAVLNLDRIWWMPSPQNPLKSTQPSWSERAQTIEKLNLPPGHIISDAEVRLGTQFTIDTLHTLRKHHPTTRFVFLMGADNFGQLPRWKDWQNILRTVPVAVIARPGSDAIKARLGRPARQFAHSRVPESAAAHLQFLSPPVWTFLTTPHNGQSSSHIRARKNPV